MKKIIALAALAIAVMPMAASAAKAKPHAKAAPTSYECSKCHMTYDAATAKKDHFKDPMDGGKLVPAKKAMTAAPQPPAPQNGNAPQNNPAPDNSMGGMKM